MHLDSPSLGETLLAINLNARARAADATMHQWFPLPLSQFGCVRALCQDCDETISRFLIRQLDELG